MEIDVIPPWHYMSLPWRNMSVMTVIFMLILLRLSNRCLHKQVNRMFIVTAALFWGHKINFDLPNVQFNRPIRDFQKSTTNNLKMERTPIMAIVNTTSNNDSMWHVFGINTAFQGYSQQWSTNVPGTTLKFEFQINTLTTHYCMMIWWKQYVLKCKS